MEVVKVDFGLAQHITQMSFGLVGGGLTVIQLEVQEISFSNFGIY